MDVISKKTRRDFQEHLVGYTLREIEALFEDRDIDLKEMPEDQLPSGQRRALVAQYYNGLDWENPKDVKKILRVYEDILHNIQARIDSEYTTDTQKSTLQGEHGRLIKALQRDGITYNEGALQVDGVTTEVALSHDAMDLLDKQQFDEYVNRIRASIDDDPALAIGSTKELVESVLKAILSNLKISFDKSDDIPKLLKEVQKALKLTPDDIDDAAKGAQIVKVLLSSLGQVVHRLNELRNLYGTGHGKEKRRRGMEPRHAKLVVGAGITLATFLLDTLKNRSSR